MKMTGARAIDFRCYSTAAEKNLRFYLEQCDRFYKKAVSTSASSACAAVGTVRGRKANKIGADAVCKAGYAKRARKE